MILPGGASSLPALADDDPQDAPVFVHAAVFNLFSLVGLKTQSYPRCFESDFDRTSTSNPNL